ncbi:phosphoglycerate mutase [Comamonas flocculans]|uniref:Phosphoglycerate mutase n=1 Tax=Comamonas flocculans TaxID=2597701 RepID=A0A5B8RXM6_9BURK|nr:phosphoglycerate mutase [Comamonas flocculans]QEA13494.1 phosphoglycerate mutase [Comamonas flocculans]
MPSARHLLIPMAAADLPGCTQALQSLRLPGLERLLARLSLQGADAGRETDYAPPHERALARTLGLPAEATPWAAWQTRTVGEPCAWVSPCHWQIGADHVVLLPPEHLGLSAEDGRALVDILAPWLAQDGIRLSYHEPTRWLVQGPPFAGLQCAPLQRVLGRDVRPWLPRGPQATRLQRLHSELQMLLYTHPWSEARAARGLPAVNALWFHGAGMLARLPEHRPEPRMPMALLQAAQRQDWAAWAAAWQQLDATEVAALAQELAGGETVELTLCGERSSLHFSSTHRGLGARITSIFQRKRLSDLREQL